MKQSERSYKRIVVKIGSSLFYSDKKLHSDEVSVVDHKKKLDFSLLSNIVEEISGLAKEGHEIIIVSSGAIALGMSVLGLQERPKELSYLQAIAAVGQNELMNKFREFFAKKDLNCAQMLLTWEDFDSRPRYLNAKNTLLTLLKLKAVPVINENDTISTEEIKFGDNDRLSALVAAISGAGLLIILSDVDGLLLNDKKTVVNIVDKITPEIKALARPTERKTSVGGMITKIEAAKIAVDSGIPCFITNGRHKAAISSALKTPVGNGTLFLPKKGVLPAKDRWIAFGTKPKGCIVVDDGAKKALLNNKSLLSVGVLSVSGAFERGDVISIANKDGNEFARGKVCICCKDLDKIKGSRSEKEVVHCDNIVIL